MAENRDTINEYLRHFSAFIGAPPLILNDQGVCAFTYENSFEIALELPEHSTQLYFYATVMAAPIENQLKFYEQLLKLNAYCADTQGATLALAPDDSRVLLCYLYPVAALDAVLFVNIVTNFVHTVQKLRELLQSTQQAAASASVIPDWQYLGNRV